MLRSWKSSEVEPLLGQGVREKGPHGFRLLPEPLSCCLPAPAWLGECSTCSQRSLFSKGLKVCTQMKEDFPVTWGAWQH